MADYQLLNNVQHKSLKVITDRGAQYGDDVMFAMTFPFEFRSAQACFPILLQGNPDTGAYTPITLFGFEEGENLFLSDDGWRAPYTPIMVQRHPFLIGFQSVQGDQGMEKRQVVSININHPRVNEQDGQAIFTEQGGYSTFLERIVTMLEAINDGHRQNELLSEQLRKFDLVESVTLEITLDDGSSNQLQGFHAVNEERLQKLSGEDLQALNSEGYLFPIYMMVASQSHLGTLVRMRNAKQNPLPNG